MPPPLSSVTTSPALVDIVGVVTRPADHHIRTEAAVEDIGTGIAGQQVIQPIAGGIDGARASQAQVLDKRSKLERHR